MPPTWLITGSSSGFGLALTRYALMQGHNVIATSRNPSKSPDLVREITSHDTGRWLTLDVTWSRPAIEIFLQRSWNEFDGGIDYLVNNAGYSLLGAAEDIPEEGAKQQFEVNFWGALRITQAILPLMRSAGKGWIINISSVAGIDPLPTCAIYSASKFALEAWSESLSKEVRSLGIRVLIVEPGGFRTNFFSKKALQIVSPSQAYEGEDHPVRKTLGKFGNVNAERLGDPMAAAKAIFEVVVGVGLGEGLSDGVLRLPLGSDCYERAVKSHESRWRELALLEQVALNTS
jgi:NAD(P)-dependent dehydrogenase (short-subunit alcohol dehydrogenase family)